MPSRASRPSLSERTIETLSHLPSSPAMKRQGSNFFDSDSLRRPQPQSRPESSDSRPESSYRSDGSTATVRSRPGSSLGQNNYNFFRAPSAHTPLPTAQDTPPRRVSASTSALVTPRPSLVKKPSRISLSTSVGPGSKTIAARPLKSRASVNGLFKHEGRTSPDFLVPPYPPRKNSATSVKSVANSTSGDRNPSGALTTSAVLTVDSTEDRLASPTSRKSSAALREQIAKVKAAKRGTSQRPSRLEAATTMRLDTAETLVIPTDTTLGFQFSDDPFGQKKFENSNRKVMQSRIETARTTGRLNISAMGLKQIPEDVLKMYDLDSIGGHDGAWAESVDVTRFVAADNEFETIEDIIFPDIDPTDSMEDEEGRGHQFAGLEFLDLHNNSLIALPTGLRRLHFLTSLNLVCLALPPDWSRVSV